MGYLSREQLSSLGFKSLGENVLISEKASLYKPHLMDIGSNVRIDDFCIVSGTVKLDDYVYIAVYSYVFGGTKGVHMKDFSCVAYGVRIFTDSDDYSGESLTNPMVPEAYKPHKKSAPIVIGRHCIIGAGSLVLPGVTLGEGTAVGAMSMVKKDTTPWSIYSGVPARKIKDRSQKLLELEKAFLNETKAKASPSSLTS